MPQIVKIKSNNLVIAHFTVNVTLVLAEDEVCVFINKDEALSLVTEEGGDVIVPMAIQSISQDVPTDFTAEKYIYETEWVLKT